MCIFKKYKDIFGKPNMGIHSYRFLNIAIIDLLLTLILSYIISYVFNKPFIFVFLFLFLFGIILHRLFCVKTTIDKLLFN